jgi:hypothetical protein
MRWLGVLALAAAVAFFARGKFAPPELQAGPLTDVTADSVRANWGGTFDEETVYTVQLSRSADFAIILDSTRTTGRSCVFTAIAPNTAVFARVSTAAAGPFTILGDTTTAVETPTAVVFDEISPNAITASAYAPAPAFTGLETGLSGVDVAMDGAYAGWRNGNIWTSRAAMSVPRFIPAAAAARGRLHALGGYAVGGSGIQASVEGFDPGAGLWSMMSSMPTGRNYLAAVAIDGLIYAVGGFNGSDNVAVNEVYDPGTNRWTSAAPMLSQRGALAAAAHDGRVYAFGGQGERGEQASIEVYDPATDAWTSGPAMSGPRAGMAAAEVNGKLYVLGGGRSSGGQFSFSGVNERFDPVRAAWEPMMPMPTARGGLVAVAVGGKIYAIGGLGGAGAAGATEEYDPGTNRWLVRAPMPSRREQMAAAALGGRIFVLGGGDGNWSTPLVEEYDPGVSRRFAGLTPNSRHEFAAKSRNRTGVETPESPKVAVYTAAVAPLPPGGPEAAFAELSGSSFVVRWSSGSAADGYNPADTEYRVELSRGRSFKTVESSRTIKGTSVRFEGLPSSTDFVVRVRAVNGDGRATHPVGLGPVRTSSSGM